MKESLKLLETSEIKLLFWPVSSIRNAMGHTFCNLREKDRGQKKERKIQKNKNKKQLEKEVGTTGIGMEERVNKIQSTGFNGPTKLLIVIFFPSYSGGNITEDKYRDDRLLVITLW